MCVCPLAWVMGHSLWMLWNHGIWLIDSHGGLSGTVPMGLGITGPSHEGWLAHPSQSWRRPPEAASWRGLIAVTSCVLLAWTPCCALLCAGDTALATWTSGKGAWHHPHLTLWNLCLTKHRISALHLLPGVPQWHPTEITPRCARRCCPMGSRAPAS